MIDSATLEANILSALTCELQLVQFLTPNKQFTARSGTPTHLWVSLKKLNLLEFDVLSVQTVIFLVASIFEHVFHVLVRELNVTFIVTALQPEYFGTHD